MEEQNKEILQPAKKFNTTGLLLWILAFAITIGSAYYQRVTGPTHPTSGSVVFIGKEIKYKLDRNNDTSSNCPVKIYTNDSSIAGTLIWKRYKTKDDWTKANMKYDNGNLTAELPAQLRAGKLQYKIRLSKEKNEIYIPSDDKEVVIRFKGEVPLPVLLIHILIMFSAMLFSTRTGVEFFRKDPVYFKYAWWTLALIFAGGLILGPIVQKYAFDAFWTGFPFGFDLTDNKTLIAFIAWAAAIFGMYKSKKPGYWILAAAIITLVIFMIPHSMFGSELDYSKMN